MEESQEQQPQEQQPQEQQPQLQTEQPDQRIPATPPHPADQRGQTDQEIFEQRQAELDYANQTHLARTAGEAPPPRPVQVSPEQPVDAPRRAESVQQDPQSPPQQEAQQEEARPQESQSQTAEPDTAGTEDTGGGDGTDDPEDADEKSDKSSSSKSKSRRRQEQVLQEELTPAPMHSRHCFELDFLEQGESVFEDRSDWLLPW
jgi:hypothetical protein